MFFCDFSDGMPEDFTIIDNDSKTLSMASMYNFDGNGWGFVGDDCLAAMYGMMVTDGLPAAITGSYEGNAKSGFDSDNWMILPIIDLTNASAATLTWKASQENNQLQYKESYEVLVSTTGTEITDFTDVIYETFAEEPMNAWSSRSADLSAYAGKTVYIAFHNNTPGANDGGALFIDDIEVTAAMGGGATGGEQEFFFCDFADGVMPEGFNTIGTDGSGTSLDMMYCPAGSWNGSWVVTTASDFASYNGDLAGVFTTAPFASTGSYGGRDGVTPADKWMITPAINLTTANAATLYWNAAQESNFDGGEGGASPDQRENYRVLVSTTGNTAADFTDAALYESSDESKGSWSSRSVDLSAYAGQTIYIAFHLNTPADRQGSALMIDDIKVTGTTGGVKETVSLVNATDAIVEGAATVEAVITAGDFTTIKAFDATLTVGDQTYTQTFSGLNVTSGQSYEFAMTQTVTGEGGALVPYTLSVKMNEATASVEGEVSILKDMDITRNVVVEEMTGTWCPNCPMGIVGIREMQAAYPETFIPIAVHYNDPMTDGVDEYANKMYSVFEGRAPRMQMNRIPTAIGEPSFSWMSQFYEEAQQGLPYCSIKAAAEFTDADEMTEIRLDATVQTAFTSNENPLRLAVVLVENNVQGNTTEYDQVNNYAKQEDEFGEEYYPLGEMGGFEEMTNPIPFSNIQYQHVARAIYDDYNGIEESLPAEVSVDATVPFTRNITVPSNVLKAKNLEVIVMAIDERTGEIMNAASCKLSDTSSIDEASQAGDYRIAGDGGIDIRFSDAQNGEVRIYTLGGQLAGIRTLKGDAQAGVAVPQGIYLVQIVTDGFTKTEKVMVK